MAQQQSPHLPIGYWLKKADELLTTRINEAQQANGLSRTEWQVLNVLHETPAVSRERIIEVLHPFGDAQRLGAVVDGLVQRGLVAANTSDAGQLQLTAQGRDVHQAALEVQRQIRQQAVRGITEADYLTTVRVLQQIVANLSDGAG